MRGEENNKTRKIISQIMVSVDGFFEGSDGEIDWHNVDEEYNEYASGLLNWADAILFGRRTYQLMADYWPTPSAISNDPVIAKLMNQLPKIVFSKTLENVEWQNSRLVKENVMIEIKHLKRQPGHNLVILGSADLTSRWTKLGLVDEYQIIVNPVVLAKGKRFFNDIHNLNLELLSLKTFRSGNVLLCYSTRTNRLDEQSSDCTFTTILFIQLDKAIT